MIRIGLFCVTGISTALLAQSLKQQLKEIKGSFKVESVPFSEIFMSGEDYDILILSPQAKFNESKVKETFPNKKIYVLSDEEFVNREMSEVIKKINLVNN